MTSYSAALLASECPGYGHGRRTRHERALQGCGIYRHKSRGMPDASAHCCTSCCMYAETSNGCEGCLVSEELDSTLCACCMYSMDSGVNSEARESDMFRWMNATAIALCAAR